MNEPIDMSQVGLGQRYSSEDMRRDFGLGSKFSVERDGVIFTDTVKSIQHTSGSPAIYRGLNRWQWMLRRLTPRRWRKSLLIRPAQLPSVTINGDTPAADWTIGQLQQMKGEISSELGNR